MIRIRRAMPSDHLTIAPLMWSSGPELYSFLYEDSALDFISYEFERTEGFCSFKHVTVAELNGVVVGAGSFYTRAEYYKMVLGTIANFIRFAGIKKAIPALLRSLHTGSVLHTPKKGELYLANFAVDCNHQSHGIGSMLFRHKLMDAQTKGYTLFGLDVAVTNPRARSLYTKLGLSVIKENRFSGNSSLVPNYHKMEVELFAP